MKKLLTFLLLIGLITSCTYEDDFAPPKKTQNAQKPENVHILSDSKGTIQFIDLENDKIILQSTKEETVYEKGDFIASGVTKQAPYGFIKKITEVKTNETQVALKTAPATLGEVFQHQAIDVKKTKTFTFHDENNKTLDVNYLGDGQFELIKEIVDGSFNSKISLTFQPEFEFVWIKLAGSQSPQTLKMAVKFNVIDFTITGTFNQAVEHRIASIELPPVTINLGIPVVFKNSLKLDMSAAVQIQSTYDAGFSVQNGYVRSGVAYYDSYGWYNISNYDFGDTQPFKPENTSYQFKGNMVFPTVLLESSPYGISAFTFYGLAELNSITDYKSTRTPSLNIYSYVRCEAGVNAKLWNIIDDNYSYDYNFPQWEFYSGNISNLPSMPGIYTTPETGRFDEITDVPEGHWAYNELKYLINNYLAGYPDNTFRPANQLTRAEFASMVVAILDPEIKPEFADRTFNDINGHWAEDVILQAARAGYLAGFPDGTFRPQNKITRLHLLVSLTNGLQQTGGEYENISPMLYDSGSISQWAEQAVANAATNNMMVNYPNKHFLRPNDQITRAEAVAIFYRALVYKGYFVNPYTSPYLF